MVLGPCPQTYLKVTVRVRPRQDTVCLPLAQQFSAMGMPPSAARQLRAELPALLRSTLHRGRQHLPRKVRPVGDQPVHAPGAAAAACGTGRFTVQGMTSKPSACASATSASVRSVWSGAQDRTTLRRDRPRHRAGEIGRAWSAPPYRGVAHRLRPGEPGQPQVRTEPPQMPRTAPVEAFHRDPRAAPRRVGHPRHRFRQFRLRTRCDPAGPGRSSSRSRTARPAAAPPPGPECARRPAAAAAGSARHRRSTGRNRPTS